MTKPITMENNANARARRRSRKRYESSDHNFDTLVLSKYDSRKTALDQNYSGATVLKESGGEDRTGAGKSRKHRSNSAKRDIYNGDYTLGTLTRKASEVAREKALEVSREKAPGPRRSSWASSRGSGSPTANKKDRTFDEDHNFDMLSQSLGSGNKMMQSRYLGDSKMLQKYENSNDYWREYHEKYGKLGIKCNENHLESKNCGSYSFRTSSSLESVTSNSKPNSPRENTVLSSLTYSNTGVIGRHSFDRKDLDEVDPDPKQSGVKPRSVSMDRSKSFRVQTSMTSSSNGAKETSMTSSSGGAKENDDEKTLGNLSEKPPRSGASRRRATSDLGFSGEEGASTPRTSALLRQPSFRKHLAKIMHVKVTNDDADDSEEQDSLTLELAFKLTSATNLMKLKNSSEEVNTSGVSGKFGNKLRASQSDHNLKSLSAENSPRASVIFDWEIPTRQESLELNDPEEEPITTSSFNIPGNVNLTSGDLGNKKEGHHAKVSKLHIPSFSEFRKLRSKRGLLPDKMQVQRREKVITEEGDLENERKGDIERSMSFSQQVQEKQQRRRTLRRTNTDPSIKVPELDESEGQGQGHNKSQGQKSHSRIQNDKDVTESKSSGAKDERSKHRKEHPRRKSAADLGESPEVQGHSRGHSRGHTVPHDSSRTRESHNQTEHVQSHKQTKPKHHRSQSNEMRTVKTSESNKAHTVKTSESSETDSFKESESSRHSIVDSEKGSDSDNGRMDSNERTKRKRRSLRKSRSTHKKVDADENNVDKSVYVIEGVTIVASDTENKRMEKERDSVESSAQAGKGPEGLPPVAPKKLHRKSDRKSSRRRQRSIPEDEELGSSDYLSSSGNFTGSTGDVQFDTENDTDDAFKAGKSYNQDQNSVTRSTSDVSEMLQEIARKRESKERRTKPYKSDPFGKRRSLREATLVKESSLENEHLRHLADGNGSGREGSSKEDIINFLHDAKKSGLSRVRSKDGGSVHSVDSNFDDYLSDEDDHHRTEVERVDSGVGSEIKEDVKPNIEIKVKDGSSCDDCDSRISGKSQIGSDSAFLCAKCASLRIERKEAIQEIVDTEISYGKDLKIIKEEFYLPMKTAGLLNADQISTIFGNLLELITVNDRFADQLQDTLDIANEQGDEDLMTVRLGKLFLEASNMLLVFEQYCVMQTAASNLVEQLEREKELLRIFLQVSQTENSALRRMNLKSFLMVPVQRIMRYPLLLSRTFKATPANHTDKHALKDAQRKVEDIIEHINSSAKESSIGTKLRRKMSGSRRYVSTGESNVELVKMALELLEWSRNDVNTVHIGKMHYTQPTDYLWAKKGKAMKFAPIMGLLMTLGKAMSEDWTDRYLFPKNTGVKEAALILVKEKNGKYVALRDPIMLERCVVSVDGEFDEVFEVMDGKKESHIFKGDNKKDTEVWFQHLKLQTKNLGQWRKRRNALPNIMMQNMAAKPKTGLT